jgi:hypothetical protein
MHVGIILPRRSRCIKDARPKNDAQRVTRGASSNSTSDAVQNVTIVLCRRFSDTHVLGYGAQYEQFLATAKRRTME